MKTLPALFLCLALVSVRGQTITSTSTSANSSLVKYIVGKQGANYRDWLKVTQTEDAQGNTVLQTNRAYVELGSGLNYWRNGSWHASRAQIELSADGSSAVATDGQYQVSFPGDLYQGKIKLVTPQGKVLTSRPLALSYFDGKHSVLIAELKDTTGELVGSNQVVYTDAFKGLKADLRYTYTPAGFEQDVILNEQPPSPAAFGLNPKTTRLEIMTEFFHSPQPKMYSRKMPTAAGNLTDETLDFGRMWMGHGKAFAIGTSARQNRMGVDKQWMQLAGRQFLVEGVPVAAMTKELKRLPLSAKASFKPSGDSPLYVVSTKRLLPAQTLVRGTPQKHLMRVAAAKVPARGQVLDYQMSVPGSITNFTFQGDTTYYISGPVGCYDTITFEAGAVLKYGSSGELGTGYPDIWSVNCQATPYRPVIFTSTNDDSVGETISGSSGTPTSYSGPVLNLFAASPTLANFRIAHAQEAIVNDMAGLNIYNGQFINCGVGIIGGDTQVNLRNALFANVGTAFSDLYTMNVDAQNVTFSGCTSLATAPTYAHSSSLILTNCILANVANYLAGNASAFTLSGNYNGFYADNSPPFGDNQIPTSNPPFQTVGAGSYYLADGGSFINKGTADIDSKLLANLEQETTQPPIQLPGPISSVTTLIPVIPRDTDTPDLGYHYYALDYLLGNVNVSATLILSNGVAVGILSPSSCAINPQPGGKVVSIGLPQTLNEVVSYQNVQEAGTYAPENAFISLNSSSDMSPSFQFQFTAFSVGQGTTKNVFAYGPRFTSIRFQDCHLYDSSLQINDSAYTVEKTFALINNLILRGIVSVNAVGINYFNCYNNLFWRGSLSSFQYGVTTWNIKDNLFDQATQSATYEALPPNFIDPYSISHNGFTTGTANSLGGNYNQTGFAADYQTGPLGSYYYPKYGGNGTLSQLIDEGSRRADQAGLFYYTTTPDQTPEVYSIVDIGFHYPVVSSYDSSSGTDFWLAWPYIFMTPNEQTVCSNVTRLIITGNLPTSGTVSAPDILGYSKSFTVTPGKPTVVTINDWNSGGFCWGNLNNWVELYDSGTNRPKGIHVVTGQPVSVIEDSDYQTIKTTWLCYPTSMLGTNYYVMSRSPNTTPLEATGNSEFAIVATKNNTHVTIKVPSGVPNNLITNIHDPIYTDCHETIGSGHAILPMSITMQAGQAFQLYTGNSQSYDATGTHIKSDQPIVVLAGDYDAQVPNAGVGTDNPLMQQMLPVESWGRQAFGFPFGDRGEGDTYRVLAAYDGTAVYVNGTQVTTLGEGEHYDFLANGMVDIRGSQPIQVAQFANGLYFDHPNYDVYNPSDVLGDPTMMLLTPAGRFMSTYTIPTPADVNWSSPVGTNYLNLVVEQSAITSTYVNGQSVYGFRPIGGSGFYGAQVPVANNIDGAPLIVSSTKPLAVQAYGFSFADAYGLMGGLSATPLAAVADAANVPLDTETSVNVLGNDIYSDAANVTVSILPNQGPAHGTAVVNTDNTISYTPNASFSGNDSFIYQIAENGQTSTAQVTLWVNNQNPTANPVTASTAYGTPVVINVVGSDSDQDGDPLSILSVGSASHGTVWLNPNSNTLTYTFNNNNFASDTFDYTITDGRGGTATSTVTVSNTSY